MNSYIFTELTHSKCNIALLIFHLTFVLLALMTFGDLDYIFQFAFLKLNLNFFLSFWLFAECLFVY